MRQFIAKVELKRKQERLSLRERYRTHNDFVARENIRGSENALDISSNWKIRYPLTINTCWQVTLKLLPVPKELLSQSMVDQVIWNSWKYTPSQLSAAELGQISIKNGRKVYPHTRGQPTVYLLWLRLWCKQTPNDAFQGLFLEVQSKVCSDYCTGRPTQCDSCARYVQICSPLAPYA